MQDGMERESIKIRFNKIRFLWQITKVHGEVIDSKLILSQNVKSNIIQVWKLITSYM